MLAEALVSSGCLYHDNPFDFETSSAEKIVVRISFPHAGVFHTPHKISKRYEKDGYQCFSLPIFRDFFSSVLSVKGRDDTRAIEAIKKEHIEACQYLSLALSYDRIIYVSYESFVAYEKYREYLFQELGLPAPKGDFFDANEKYYA